MIKNILNLGDAAVYCDFGKEVNQSINSNVISYFKHLQELVKEKNSIPINQLVPKGMTIKEYFGKEQRLLREENISYVKFDKDGYQ